MFFPSRLLSFPVGFLLPRPAGFFLPCDLLPFCALVGLALGSPSPRLAWRPAGSRRRLTARGRRSPRQVLCRPPEFRRERVAPVTPFCSSHFSAWCPFLLLFCFACGCSWAFFALVLFAGLVWLARFFCLPPGGRRPRAPLSLRSARPSGCARPARLAAARPRRPGALSLSPLVPSVRAPRSYLLVALLCASFLPVISVPWWVFPAASCGGSCAMLSLRGGRLWCIFARFPARCLGRSVPRLGAASLVVFCWRCSCSLARAAPLRRCSLASFLRSAFFRRLCACLASQLCCLAPRCVSFCPPFGSSAVPAFPRLAPWSCSCLCCTCFCHGRSSLPPPPSFLLSSVAPFVP